ncbi:hypothetical protein L3556_02955 [Candidatus Synechococcus calcipolaris G9]|uniref:Dynamin family protein n=1 Tax=Candidatus Synechococcus calcipolaris G9 TaxID=1497997 RepID=A0ABT6EVT6_9SYNE|nr:hypothetical protein [Candidatus Synechococcus calcipolaris]MDG2989897.1 hypothetical protein [Candidatus Synechococcus calcipolaris G9]
MDKVMGNLQSLTSALRQLEQHRIQLFSESDDLETTGRLQEINLTALQNEISSEFAVLGKLKIRFSRNTLNIGVIGRARQGKSRLLQTLSGLSSAEIPSGDRSHCTGVRSTIHHNPGVKTYGEVWFYSEREFLSDVIGPYYDKLQLGSRPFSLDSFARTPLPGLPESLQGIAELGAMYEHLRKYHSNFDQYKHLLNVISPQQISKEQIREYVAQDNEAGERIYFNYLAVKEAKVVCGFPNEDVGQIALIDMPGLGDTGLGDAERLMTILGQDVDVVLFIRMPKPPGDFWADVDVKLYDTARASLVDLPIHNWAFMVLNQTAANSLIGDNARYCEDLTNSLATSHINVVECITASCADPQQANQKVLDKILNYLLENITSLDKRYAKACQDRLIRIQSEVQIELEKAKKAMGFGGQKDGWFPLFIKLFNQLWDDLTGGLRKLLDKLEESRDCCDEDLQKQLKIVLASARQDTRFPSVEQIEICRDREGGYPNAYYRYLNEVRANLSRHFLSLDDGLKRSLYNIKSEVAEVLIQDGRMGKITDARGTEFLKIIEALIPDELGQLKLGFNILASFELSYRGLIQHRIRKNLDRLTPDKAPVQLSETPSASEIHEILSILYEETLYDSEESVEKILAEPSQAAYAIVEEFLDRVLRSEGVKDEWQIFLEENRSDIWTSEFEKLGQNSRLKREWLKSIDESLSRNRLDLMQFT